MIRGRVYPEGFLWAAHAHVKQNRLAIESADCGVCVCFDCKKILVPSQITVWAYENGMDLVPSTAVCPGCGMDTIIADTSGYPILEQDFLDDMRDYFLTEPTHTDRHQ